MPFELPDELKFIANGRLPQKHTDASMKGKVCVISGATSGIGYEAALKLAKAGAGIVLLARNEEKAKKVSQEITSVNGMDTPYFLADFSRLSDVRRAVKQLLDQHPRVDVLINCVGIHNTKRELTPDGYEKVFYVNHLSNFLVTKMMIPRMVGSAPSRIILVNSEGHRFGGLNFNDLNWEKRIYLGLGSYGAAKTAQLLSMLEFNDQLIDTGVTINAMHPGAVKTNIGNNNGFLYRFWLHNVMFHFMKEADIAGDALYYLAAAPELASVSGKFFNLTHEEKPAEHALDRFTSKLIYNKSEEIISEID